MIFPPQIGMVSPKLQELEEHTLLLNGMLRDRTGIAKNID